MGENSKEVEVVVKGSRWTRFFHMAIVAFMCCLMLVGMFCLVIVQAVSNLLFARSHPTLLDFGNRASFWFSKAFQFLTYNNEERPFPYVNVLIPMDSINDHLEKSSSAELPLSDNKQGIRGGDESLTSSNEFVGGADSALDKNLDEELDEDIFELDDDLALFSTTVNAEQLKEEHLFYPELEREDGYEKNIEDELSFLENVALEKSAEDIPVDNIKEALLNINQPPLLNDSDLSQAKQGLQLDENFIENVSTVTTGSAIDILEAEDASADSLDLGPTLVKSEIEEVEPKPIDEWAVFPEELSDSEVPADQASEKVLEALESKDGYNFGEKLDVGQNLQRQGLEEVQATKVTSDLVPDEAQLVNDPLPLSDSAVIENDPDSCEEKTYQEMLAELVPTSESSTDEIIEEISLALTQSGYVDPEQGKLAPKEMELKAGADKELKNSLKENQSDDDFSTVDYTVDVSKTQGASKDKVATEDNTFASINFNKEKLTVNNDRKAAFSKQKSTDHYSEKEATSDLSLVEKEEGKLAAENFGKAFNGTDSLVATDFQNEQNQDDSASVNEAINETIEVQEENPFAYKPIEATQFNTSVDESLEQMAKKLTNSVDVSAEPVDDPFGLDAAYKAGLADIEKIEAEIEREREAETKSVEKTNKSIQTKDINKPSLPSENAEGVDKDQLKFNTLSKGEDDEDDIFADIRFNLPKVDDNISIDAADFDLSILESYSEESDSGQK